MYGLMPAPCPPAVLAAELAATEPPRERPRPPEDRAPLHTQLDAKRLTDAAAAARKRYPGPVGDFLARELQMWRTEQLRFVNGSIVHKLVDALLTDENTA